MAKYLEGTLYQRSSTGAWVYETKVYDSNGYSRSKTISGPTRRITQQKAKEFEARRGQEVEAVVTLRDHYASWIAHCESRCAKMTLRSYRQVMDIRVMPTLGGIALTKITAKHVDELMSKLNADGHDGGAYSARGINITREVLRNCLNVAVRWGLIKSNPVILTKTVKGEAYIPQSVGEAEFAAVRAALSSNRSDRPLLVCLLSGMRFSECLGLTVDAMDFTNNVISVHQQLLVQKTGFELSPTKTVKSRRVLPMTQGLRDILMQQVSDLTALPEPPKGYAGLLFRTSNGTPVAHNNLRRRFRKVLEANGLPPMRVHDLRHAYTSLLIQKGVPAKAVSDLLGHTSVSITVNRYAHMTNSLNAKFVSMLDDIGK